MPRIDQSMLRVAVGLLFVWLAVFIQHINFRTVDYAEVGTEGFRLLQLILLMIAFAFLMAPAFMDMRGR